MEEIESSCMSFTSTSFERSPRAELEELAAGVLPKRDILKGRLPKEKEQLSSSQSTLMCESVAGV